MLSSLLIAHNSMKEKNAQDLHDYEKISEQIIEFISTSEFVNTIVNLAFYLQGHKVILVTSFICFLCSARQNAMKYILSTRLISTSGHKMHEE